MQRSLCPRVLGSALALSLLGLAGGARAQKGGVDPSKLVAAQALYEEATKAMDAKDYATACPKLEEVVKLVPEGVGGRLTLAECQVAAGKLASAYASYALAETMAAAAKQPEREKEAHAQAEALKPKLATLRIVVADGVRKIAGLEIQRDGVVVASTAWEMATPVDKGRHVIKATADGKQAWEKTIEVSADGVVETVRIDAMVDTNTGTASPAAPPVPVQPPSMRVAPVVTAPAGGGRDKPRPAATSLSHRGQLGAVLRADIDGMGPGVVAAPGLSYGLGDYVEVAACALVGRSKGFEVGSTFFVLRGALKPRISLAVPIFIVSGARPGVRASAGLQWDPIRHVGLFVEAGVAAFPNAPMGYDKVIFVPSLGVQPRL